MGLIHKIRSNINLPVALLSVALAIAVLAAAALLLTDSDQGPSTPQNAVAAWAGPSDTPIAEVALMADRRTIHVIDPKTGWYVAPSVQGDEAALYGVGHRIMLAIGEDCDGEWRVVADRVFACGTTPQQLLTEAERLADPSHHSASGHMGTATFSTDGVWLWSPAGTLEPLAVLDQVALFHPVDGDGTVLVDLDGPEKRNCVEDGASRIAFCNFATADLLARGLDLVAWADSVTAPSA